MTLGEPTHTPWIDPNKTNCTTTINLVRQVRTDPYTLERSSARPRSSFSHTLLTHTLNASPRTCLLVRYNTTQPKPPSPKLQSLLFFDSTFHPRGYKSHAHRPDITCPGISVYTPNPLSPEFGTSVNPAYSTPTRPQSWYRWKSAAPPCLLASKIDLMS